jgi:hypothetical protein
MYRWIASDPQPTNTKGGPDGPPFVRLQDFMCVTGATAGRTFRFGLRVAF